MGFALGSSGPLDKFKFTVGEGGVRSPLLISGPGIKGGRQIDPFAYVTDIMPTILELAGVDYPDKFQGRKIEPMRGRSMAGILDGTKKAIYSETDFVGGEMLGGKWMRQGDFKAVMIPEPIGTGEWQLFNVVKDPGEAKDLSAAMPNKLETLKAAWERYAKEVGVVLPK
jgi:arylsulfatase